MHSIHSVVQCVHLKKSETERWRCGERERHTHVVIVFFINNIPGWGFVYTLTQVKLIRPQNPARLCFIC